MDIHDVSSIIPVTFGPVDTSPPPTFSGVDSNLAVVGESGPQQPHSVIMTGPAIDSTQGERQPNPQSAGDGSPAATAAPPVNSQPSSTGPSWWDTIKSEFNVPRAGLFLAMTNFGMMIYLNQRSFIESAKMNRLTHWKDCHDRPDMRNMPICLPFLKINHSSIMRRGLNLSELPLRGITSAIAKSQLVQLDPPSRAQFGPRPISDVGGNSTILSLMCQLLALEVAASLAHRVFSVRLGIAEHKKGLYRLINVAGILGLEILLIRCFPDDLVNAMLDIASWSVLMYIFMGLTSALVWKIRPPSSPAERLRAYIRGRVLALSSCAAGVALSQVSLQTASWHEPHGWRELFHPSALNWVMLIFILICVVFCFSVLKLLDPGIMKSEVERLDIDIERLDKAFR